MLLFFDRFHFSELKIQKEKEGYTFYSIIQFIRDVTLIDTFNQDDSIIDITGLIGYGQNLQTIAEEIILKFDNELTFIADKKHEEVFRYDLRYCFSEFDHWIPSDSIVTQNSEDSILKPSSKIQHRKITDLEDDEVEQFITKFNSSLYGHNKFKDDFYALIKTFRVFNKINEHKILSLFLLGDSGVGKTEVARLIYKSLGGKKKLAKVNFGNYSSEFSLSSLIGSARGYIGSEDGEIFMRTRDTDVGIILIDEFEKSNATIFNYFLDVLESGKIISSLAEEIDLNGFIIVFTSNISKDDFSIKISPELRSRFDYKCLFTVLYNIDKEKYVEFRIQDILKKYNEKHNMSLDLNIGNILFQKINVSNYSNMRDLNKRIKSVFVDFLSSNK